MTSCTGNQTRVISTWTIFFQLWRLNLAALLSPLNDAHGTRQRWKVDLSTCEYEEQQTDRITAPIHKSENQTIVSHCDSDNYFHKQETGFHWKSDRCDGWQFYRLIAGWCSARLRPVIIFTHVLHSATIIVTLLEKQETYLWFEHVF